MQSATDELKELLSKDMSEEDFENLVLYFKQLTHELGNGVLTKIRQNKSHCSAMIKRAGDLDDFLKE